MSFPKELNLGSNRPMAAAGKPSINRYRSDNSSYSGGDIIRLEIPCGRRGQYLFPQDSVIEGRLSLNYSITTVAVGGAVVPLSVYIDQSVYALFNRMRVIHGSTVVEDTLYSNRLWTALYDLQVSEAKRRGDTITKLVFDNSIEVGNYETNGSAFCNHLTGSPVVLSVNALTANTQTLLVDFCFTLPSAVLGSLCSKAIPLGLMGASSIYLELELANTNVAFVAGGGTGTTPCAYTVNSYTIQDIYYNAKIVTLPQDVDDLIIQSTGGVINIPAVAYKCEQKSISSGSSTFNDKFSFQFSSLKTFLFWFASGASAVGNIGLRSISSRPKCFLSDYFLLINGEAYPSQQIGYGTGATENVSRNSARMFAETQRALNYLTDVNAGGIMNFYNYNFDDATVMEGLASATALTTVDPGGVTIQKRFVAGIDLDRFNRSSDVLMCGTSSIGQMININMEFSQGCGTTLAGNNGAATNINLYASVMYDVLFHVENGQMLAKF